MEYPTYFEVPKTLQEAPLLNGNINKFVDEGCDDLYDCFYAEIRYSLKPEEEKIELYKNRLNGEKEVILFYQKVGNFFQIGSKIFSSVKQTFKI